MKIGVIGTQCIGKTTFIQDFIANWPMYKLCEKPRYTDLIKEKNLSLNEDGNEESQKIILNSVADQAMYSTKSDNIIFDRSVLDNLVYTIWLNSRGKVSDAFVKETIDIVRESLVFYDILFFLPITKQTPIRFEAREHRSISPEYRIEIDNIFKALVHQYNTGSKVYFPFDHKTGCPAIIEIFGGRQERVQLAKFYINPKGKSFSDKESLLAATDEELEAKRLLESAFSPIQGKNKTIIPVTMKNK